MLHGQPGLGADWETVIARLDPEFSVSAVDRPGYGTNVLSAGDFEANARAVLAEMDAKNIDEAVVIGHSFGGGIALTVANMAPKRVAALVLVNSVAPGCTDGWDRLLAAPVAGEICALAAWWLTPRFARARLDRIARLRGRPIEHDEHVNWQVWGRAEHEHGAMWRTFLLEQRAVMRSLDHLVDELHRVAAPTLVIADPLDPLIPIASQHALCRLLPNARLELIEVGAHHLPRRAPAEVAAAINDFLAALGS